MPDLTQNYFSLFGLHPQFEIDEDLLRQRYRDIQTQVHPDRFASKPDQEQRLAVQSAAFVNEAYQCLKNPLERARYLLVLKGMPDKFETESHMDADFLMEQIALREELESIAARDAPAVSVNNLLEKISGKIKQASKLFLLSYNKGDNKAASDVLVKWQFLVKLQQDVERMEESRL